MKRIWEKCIWRWGNPLLSAVLSSLYAIGYSQNGLWVWLAISIGWGACVILELINAVCSVLIESHGLELLEGE